MAMLSAFAQSSTIRYRVFRESIPAGKSVNTKDVPKTLISNEVIRISDAKNATSISMHSVVSNDDVLTTYTPTRMTMVHMQGMIKTHVPSTGRFVDEGVTRPIGTACFIYTTGKSQALPSGQTILGHMVVRYLIDAPGPRMNELAFAPDLGCALLRRVLISTNPSTGVTTKVMWIADSIAPGEPDMPEFSVEAFKEVPPSGFLKVRGVGSKAMAEMDQAWSKHSN